MPTQEQQRLYELTRYEEEARCQGFNCIAGIDEAGRGPLAGPVVAAACIIPQGVFFPGIDDSKKLTADERSVLFDMLIAHPKVIYAIQDVDSNEIDRINIYQATIKAMLQAVARLSIVPDILFVDGMSLPHPYIPSKKIIKGDSLSQSIAAASVLAKVTRDRIMEGFDEKWPQYGFKQHKGYATPQHFQTIAENGPCPIHRFSFEPIKTYGGGPLANEQAIQLDFCEKYSLN